MWGDDLDAPRRLVEGGPIDYLMLDYLAEVTMSILQKQKARDPQQGYARDFIGMLESILPAVTDRGVKVLADAGGVNPAACADAVRAMAAARGASEKVRVGVVTGDDLMPRLDELLAGGHVFENLDTGAPLAGVRDRVVAANAYIGSAPLADALAKGANVVVTGRCNDAALALAPLRHEFGWAGDDWHRLAAGVIAGHVIECGAQCTGGNCLHEWRSLALGDVGYPIVEVQEDGEFVVTKHPGTGGRVSVPGVTEQLLYEIGDPRAYYSPDVVADFTALRLTQEKGDRVRVQGSRGTAAPEKLKVSIAYRWGWKAVGTLTYAWPDALEKAEMASRVLRERLHRLGLRFDSILFEYVGASATHGSHSGPAAREAPEVTWRVSVRDPDRRAVERFTREIAPLVLNGPPSVTGYGQARGKVEEVVAYWPTLVDRTVVLPRVEVLA